MVQVRSVALLCDGQLASDLYDKSVRTQDTATGVLKETLNTKLSFTELEISQDSSYVLTKIGLSKI